MDGVIIMKRLIAVVVVFSIIVGNTFAIKNFEKIEEFDEYIMEHYGPFIYEKVEFGNYASVYEYDVNYRYHIGISFYSEDGVTYYHTFRSASFYEVHDMKSWDNWSLNIIGYVFDLGECVVKFGEISYVNRWVFIPADAIMFISYYPFPEFARDYYDDILSEKLWSDYRQFCENPKRQSVEYPLIDNQSIKNREEDLPIGTETGPPITGETQ